MIQCLFNRSSKESSLFHLERPSLECRRSEKVRGTKPLRRIRVRQVQDNVLFLRHGLEHVFWQLPLSLQLMESNDPLVLRLEA